MGATWCCCHNVVFLFVFFNLLVLGPWSDVFFSMPSLFSLDLECKRIEDAHVFLFVFPLVAVDLFACRALCLNARAQPSFAHIGSTYTPTHTHTSALSPLQTFIHS